MIEITLALGEQELHRVTTQAGALVVVTSRRLIFQGPGAGAPSEQVRLSEIRGVRRLYCRAVLRRQPYVSLQTSDTLVRRRVHGGGMWWYAVQGDIAILCKSVEEADSLVAAIQNAVLQFGG